MAHTLTFYDEVATLKIKGAITPINLFIFQNKLKEILNHSELTCKKISRLEIDLNECDYIHSVGIHKFLSYYHDFIKKDIEIEITDCSENVYKLLMIIKLNQLISININLPDDIYHY